MSVPFLYINGVLSLMLGDRVVQVDQTHPSYGLIKKSLKTATEKQLSEMVDIQKSTEAYVTKESNGRARVSNGVVYFNNKPVHETLSTRILEFMQNGLPFSHLLRFMENVELNPSNKAKLQLFDFLEHKNLPITEEGNFLAYKTVRGDNFDKYSGTILNAIGSIIEVPRNTVNDDREVGCSTGLHVGSLEYAGSYGSNGDKMLIVKINPKDVVSVPRDANFQKLRTCRYEIISEFNGELTKPLYTDRGNNVESPIDDKSYDWSWADRHNENYDYDDDDEWDDEDDDDFDDDWDDEEDYEDEYYNYPNNKPHCDCDNLTKKDVTVTPCRKSRLGIKPDGSFYHNKRDNQGRFTRWSD